MRTTVKQRGILAGNSNRLTAA